MSKAFTSESDEDDAATLPEEPVLPAGAKNYITPQGAQRLRAEIEQLEKENRLISNDVAAKGKRQRLQVRREYLERRLATVVEIAPQSADEILFGAWVKLEGSDEPMTIRIVGVDEVDVAAGAVSWISPLASRLLGHKVGDRVQLPAGTYRISHIDYSASSNQAP